MNLLERVEQLEQELKTLRPELHFPSTATLEHRLSWLEIVIEEMRARDNHGLHAKAPLEEKLAYYPVAILTISVVMRVAGYLLEAGGIEIPMLAGLSGAVAFLAIVTFFPMLLRSLRPA